MQWRCEKVSCLLTDILIIPDTKFCANATCTIYPMSLLEQEDLTSQWERVRRQKVGNGAKGFGGWQRQGEVSRMRSRVQEDDRAR